MRDLIWVPLLKNSNKAKRSSDPWHPGSKGIESKRKMRDKEREEGIRDKNRPPPGIAPSDTLTDPTFEHYTLGGMLVLNHNMIRM